MDRKKVMHDNASRRGAVDLGMPLMILAFIVIIGFMYWLKLQSDAEMASRVVEEAPTEEVVDDFSGLDIDANALGMDASPFEAQEVRLRSLAVASLLGTQGFWVELPNGNPFLVELTGTTTVQAVADHVLAEEVPVRPGEVVTVVGMVMPMTMELLDGWEGAGTITSNDRIVAEFATHYIEASRVDVAAAAGGSTGQ